MRRGGRRLIASFIWRFPQECSFQYPNAWRNSVIQRREWRESLSDIIPHSPRSPSDTDNLFQIEKPFGKDLESSRELHNALAPDWREDETFRIDHYLGKEMVKNMTFIRFSNELLGATWNRNHIANVQVCADQFEYIFPRLIDPDHFQRAIRDGRSWWILWWVRNHPGRYAESWVSKQDELGLELIVVKICYRFSPL